MTDRAAPPPAAGPKEQVPARTAASPGRSGCDASRTDFSWASDLPVVALVALFLLATSRWGSYLTVPGAPFYIGDIALVLGVAQTALLLLRGRLPSASSLDRAPLVMLLVIVLVGITLVRLVLSTDLSLVALRDAAPYMYAVAAVLGFLLPADSHRRWRLVVYATIAFHLAWSVVLKYLPGFPWGAPVLGTDAQVLAIRPDFDATVLGIGAAFALHDLWSRRSRLRRVSGLALALLAVVSITGMLLIATRAGLLAGLSPIAVVVLAGLLRRRGVEHRPRASRRRSIILAVVGLGVVVVAMALTPAGQRILEGFRGGSGAGTINARQVVWTHVVEYVFISPERTAMGVGFGRDFIVESGSTAALEGEYQNVRSPHNYVVGTLARLGVAGALLVSVIMVLGWWLAWSALRGSRAGPVTVLAALVAISIPLVSLLGVVLEAPFGAIPYFWAVGQLAATVRHGHRSHPMVTR